MAIYRQYVKAYDAFAGYDDFCEHFRLKEPERFHFAFDVADALARDTPHATALAWASADGEEGRGDPQLSFAQMKALSDRAANALRALGVGKGDVVLLMLKNHWEHWPLLLAAHKLGAVAAPTPHQLTAQDIAYRLGRAAQAMRVAMVIATAEDGIPERVERAVEIACGGGAPELLLVRGERAGWRSYEAAMAGADPHFERPQGAQAVLARDPLLLYFTSGTEGMPKMVLHDQLYPLGHIVTAVHWQRVVEGGLHLAVCDAGGSKSAWGQIYGQWMAGSGVFVWDAGEVLDAAALLKTLARRRVNTLCAPPGVYRALLGQEVSAYDLSALSHCTVISEPLHPEIYFQFLEQTGLHLHEAYGLAETGVVVGNFAPFGKVQPGSMGRPSPLYDVDVVDAYGNSCPAGVSGEIVVRTDRGVPAGMFHGYAGGEEERREAWDGHAFRTGDVVWRDEWGYYWYVGRADDVVRSSGYRIGPFEVESALMEHPGVKEAAVTGAPDPLRHQIVKAAVVLQPGYQPGEAMVRVLQEHVKRVTAPYKCPRVIDFVDALPRTGDGKIKRSALR